MNARILSGIATFALVAAGAASPAGQPSPGPVTEDAQLPLSFEPNVGQLDPGIRFLARGRGGRIAIADSGGPRLDAAGFSMGFAGAASEPRVEGIEILPGSIHHLVGADPAGWTVQVPTYAGVAIRSLYPGIDLLVRGDRRRLDVTFVLAPEADPDAIAWAPGGRVRSEATAYQLVNGEERSIDATYRTLASGRLGLAVARYDVEQPLHVRLRVPLEEPEVERAGARVFRAAVDAQGNVTVAGTVAGESGERILVATLSPDASTVLHTTYLGGAGDELFDLALDPEGSAILAGSRRVTKLTEDGSGIVFSTLLSGVDSRARGIAIDATGRIWVAGSEGQDAFVTVLSPAGAVLSTTRFGGGGHDVANAIAIGSDGSILVAGSTASPDFPEIGSPLTARTGDPGTWSEDAFLVRLRPADLTLDYAARLGGSGADAGLAIAVDAAGLAYLTGRTDSPDFPVLSSPPPDPAARGAFVVGVDCAAGRLAFGTLLDRAVDDEGRSVAIDPTGGVRVAGGGTDAFVAFLDARGVERERTILAGGDGADTASGIALAGSGSSWLAGVGSTSALLPSRTLEPAAGGGDAYVAPLDVPLVLACPGTISFDNSAGTSLWETAANWNLNRLPNSTDSVCIGAGFNVALSSGTQTVNNLTVDAAGSLTISGGSLSLATASTAGGAFSLTGGTLTGAGSLTISGLLTWTGGTMDGSGITNANGGISFSGFNVKDLNNGRRINSSGTATWAGTGDVRVGNGGVISNTGTWDAQSDASISNAFGGAATFTNGGTFRKSAGTGTTSVSIPLNNNVTVNVQTGTIDLSGGGTHTGSFTGSAGATLQLSGFTPHDLLASSSVTAPLVVIPGGTVNIAGSYAVTNRTTVSGGTVSFNSGSSSAAVTFSGGTIGGTGTFTVTGLLTWTGGTMDGSGITNANGGISLSGFNVKDLNNGRALNTSGTTTWAGTGDVRVGNGGVIHNTGTWDAQDDASMSNAFGGAATFTNGGTFKKSAGTGTTTVGIPFDNSFTATAQTGRINFGGGGASTGSFTGSAGASLEFSGFATHDLLASSSVSAPAVVFSGGTTNVSGTYSATSSTTVTGGAVTFLPASTITGVGSALTASAGTVTFTSGNTISPSTMSLNGGTVAGSDTLTISGLLTWTAGTMDGSGITNANGGISFSGFNVKDLINGRTLNSPGTATWAGVGGIRLGNGATIVNTGTWDAQDDGSISNAFGGAATFTNGGTFRKSAGIGTSSVSIPLNNNSTVNVQTGTIALEGGGTHTGSFTGSAGATLQLSSFTSHDLLASSSVTAPLVVMPSGPVNVAGTYAVTNRTTVSGGTVSFNSASSSAAVTFSAGTIGGTGTLTIPGPLTWTGGTMDGSGTTNANGGISFSGFNVKDLNNGRRLNSAGTTTWAGTADVRLGNGATIVNTGTWEAQIDASISNAFGGAASFTNGGTFKKSAGTGITSVSIPMTNTGAVEAAAGTLSFSGGYTQTAGSTSLNGGALTSSTVLDIQGGTLRGFGTATANVTSGGTVSPGLSPAILNVSGTYAQTAGGALSVEIGGTTVGTQYDRLAVSGSATLAGTLTGGVINGFAPAVGNVFTILTSGSRSGTFATTTLGSPGCGLAWQVGYTATNVTLSVAQGSCPDVDNDGFAICCGGCTLVAGDVCGDCNDADGSVWAVPGEATGMVLASNKQTISWTAPALPGGAPGSTVYDTIRSGSPSDFVTSATCVESNDGSNTSAADSATPAPGARFAYLVRAQNLCGEGTLGTRTDGTPRVARACP